MCVLIPYGRGCQGFERKAKREVFDMSGKVSGIGIELKFDEASGYGLVLRIIPGSVAEKSGLKDDDQILSVDGKK